jgi:hypothetical protein
LKAEYHNLLTTDAIKSNLRRYIQPRATTAAGAKSPDEIVAELAAGAYTRPLFGSTQALSVG